MEKQLFIVDTDPGIDDTQAIFIMLQNYHVKAFTTVAGNSSLENSNRNIARCLKLANQEVPIYSGSDQPLIVEYRSASYFHGENGIGDHIEHESSQDSEEEKVRKSGERHDHCIQTDKTAARAIVDIVNENVGNISILAIAPLTNIALAFKLDPSLPEKIKEIIIMGGTLNGRGNFKKNLEFNFGNDPHAAHIVIKNFKNIHLVPWEASHEFKVTPEEHHLLLDETMPKTLFYKQINTMNLKRFGHLDFCDGLAAALAVDKSIASYHDLEAEVYTDGHAAGQISYAWPGYCGEYDASKVNVRVYYDFKHQESMDIWLKAFRT